MTVREAIEQADQLRPNNPCGEEQKQTWLRQADGHIRRGCIARSDTTDFDDVGNVELLLPEPYDGAYVHWLCAQIDLALSETDRYTNEAQQYNNEVQRFAAELRRKYKPKAKARFRY
jgi:hypothetical protein